MAYKVNQSVIDKAKKDYEDAKARGDKAGMEKAHATAEAERTKAGYSGGADGSQKIPTSTKTSPTNYSGSATGVNTYTSDQDKIKAQMNANSQAWYGASKEEQDRLHAENERLAALLGGDVSGGYDPVAGTWTGSAGVPTSRPTYSDPYASDLDALLQSILTRPAFSYDYTKDPLFNQYKQQYMREGQRAMQDTLASAAAQAGGMNSYAITAGQQAQNYYGAQLGDKIPELWNLAYGMYLDDIDNDVRNMGLLNQMSDTQYNRYRDTMADWENDRDFAYNKWRDEIGDSYLDKEWEYMLSRDAIEDQRYNDEWNYKLAQASKGSSSSNSNGYYEGEGETVTVTANDIRLTVKQMLEAGASEDEMADYLADQIERGLDPTAAFQIAINYGIKL